MSAARLKLLGRNSDGYPLEAGPAYGSLGAAVRCAYDAMTIPESDDYIAKGRELTPEEENLKQLLSTDTVKAAHHHNKPDVDWVMTVSANFLAYLLELCFQGSEVEQRLRTKGFVLFFLDNFLVRKFRRDAFRAVMIAMIGADDPRLDMAGQASAAKVMALEVMFKHLIDNEGKSGIIHQYEARSSLVEVVANWSTNLADRVANIFALEVSDYPQTPLAVEETAAFYVGGRVSAPIASASADAPPSAQGPSAHKNIYETLQALEHEIGRIPKGTNGLIHQLAEDHRRQIDEHFASLYGPNYARSDDGLADADVASLVDDPTTPCQARCLGPLAATCIPHPRASAVSSLITYVEMRPSLPPPWRPIGSSRVPRSRQPAKSALFVACW